jgi:hypothetical protein
MAWRRTTFVSKSIRYCNPKILMTLF